MPCFLEQERESSNTAQLASSFGLHVVAVACTAVCTDKALFQALG